MSANSLIGPIRTPPRLEDLTRALLYEGYALFPYHRAAVKNTKPVPFGAVYPEAYRAHHPEAPSLIQTECLVVGAGEDLAVQASVRFLQLQTIELQEWTEAAGLRVVESLAAGAETHQSGWQGVEREVRPQSLALWRCAADWTACRIEFPERRQSRLLHDARRQIIGRRLARTADLTGRVTVAYSPVEGREDCYQVAVRIHNATPVPDAATLSRDEIARHAFLSTHTLLTVTGGEFRSVLEPEPEWETVAAQCRNVGTWPVLLDGDQTTLLSSPIILHDYPELAPQSQGDLFDGSEIEEALLLHLAAMSDAEKKTLATADDRLRAMLERVSQVTPQEILNLHGVLHATPPPKV